MNVNRHLTRYEILHQVDAKTFSEMFSAKNNRLLQYFSELNTKSSNSPVPSNPIRRWTHDLAAEPDDAESFKHDLEHGFTLRILGF